MSHLVIFTSADNSAGFEPCNDLKSAAAVVERLRNDQDIDNARIFRLEEVKFEVKTYYKVEVGEGDAKAKPAKKAADEPFTATVSEPAAPTIEPVIDAPAAAVSSIASEMATLIASPVAAAPVPVATPMPAAPTAGESDDLADLEASAMGQRRGLFGR